MAVLILAAAWAVPCWGGSLGAWLSAARLAPARGSEGAAGASKGTDHPVIRVDQVVPGGPAESAGVRPGDGIVAIDGAPVARDGTADLAAVRAHLAALPEGRAVVLEIVRDEVTVEAGPGLTAEEQAQFTRDPESFARARGAGFSATLTARVERRELRTRVVLGRRPGLDGPEIPPSSALFPALPTEPHEHSLAREARAWIAEAGVEDDCRDLWRRLARLEERGDFARSPAVVLAHREPWRTPALFDELIVPLRVAAGDATPVAEDLRALVEAVAGPLAGTAPLAPRSAELPAPTGAPLAGHVTWMRAVLERAAEARARALSRLTAEEVAFVEAHWRAVGDRLQEGIYLYDDPDAERRAACARLLEIGARVDRREMLGAARTLLRLANRAWLTDLARALEDDGADVAGGGVLLDEPSPHGRIVVAGGGDSWHRSPAGTQQGVAVLIDLGGDDFYSGAAGSTVHESRGDRALHRAVPLSIAVDVSGDDAYEATGECAQGAGLLGVGALVDLDGDDSYIARRWGQGVGLFGVGVLADAAGRDHYRGLTLCQGVGLYGAGVLWDRRGDDEYSALRYAQALALPGSAALLLEGAGDDHYYAKGDGPTNYGDEGIFDAWSQGCGLGFRTQASGGVAMLIDRAGRDSLEAGNFAQGGGYYFGAGVLVADGADDDRYLGSRYGQGFSAHQAVGYFREAGGDDVYETRQAVMAGLAWDESVTFFLELAGDDRYDGGGFSLGASAHNSFALFWDADGHDRYLRPPLARAGGNNYHGGTSLSIFVDDGGEDDEYPGDLGDDRTVARPEHAIFVDR